MSWKVPGQPYEVEVQGIKVKCKTLEDGDRMKLMAKIMDARKVKDDPESIRAVYDMVESQVIAVSADLGGLTPGKAIRHQDVEFIMELWQRIIQGGSLSEDEAKNSGSSLGAPQASSEENTPATAEKDVNA